MTKASNSLPENGISINKYISSRGVCSRREADRMLEKGQVTLNGKIAKKGNRVIDGDQVAIKGKLLPTRNTNKPVYILLNKPQGIVSTTSSKDPNNVIEYIDFPERIFPIGRLDKDSEGLLLLTNDGDIVNKILRASNAHEKEYLVTVNKPVEENFLYHMRKGVPILDTITLPAKVTQVGKNSFKIILTQGLNRQIRRMCEQLGYEVRRLKRIRIMHITDEKLEVGTWRHLRPSELKKLSRATEDSTKNPKEYPK